MNGFAVTSSSVATSILLKYLRERERERDFIFNDVHQHFWGFGTAGLPFAVKLFIESRSKIENRYCTIPSAVTPWFLSKQDRGAGGARLKPIEQTIFSDARVP